MPTGRLGGTSLIYFDGDLLDPIIPWLIGALPTITIFDRWSTMAYRHNY